MLKKKKRKLNEVDIFKEVFGDSFNFQNNYYYDVTVKFSKYGEINDVMNGWDIMAHCDFYGLNRIDVSYTQHRDKWKKVLKVYKDNDLYLVATQEELDLIV